MAVDVAVGSTVADMEDVETTAAVDVDSVADEEEEEEVEDTGTTEDMVGPVVVASVAVVDTDPRHKRGQ